MMRRVQPISIIAGPVSEGAMRLVVNHLTLRRNNSRQYSREAARRFVVDWAAILYTIRETSITSYHFLC